MREKEDGERAQRRLIRERGEGMMKRMHIVETEYMPAKESDPEKSCRSVVGQQKATELSDQWSDVRCAAPRERVNCSPFAAFVCPSP